MAEKKGGVPKTSAKLGDIDTAAKSTMKPESYEHGYPTQPGILHNANYGSKGGKK